MDTGGEQGTGPYLEGHLLVAMPTMADPRFAHTVIYMCAHSEDGAMGLVVNKLLESLSFSDLLEQLEIETETVDERIRVHFGGPVEAARGFVLHSTDYTHEATMQVDDEFALTATVDVLKAMATGNGPRLSMLALAMQAGRRASSTARFRRTAGSPCRPTRSWSSTRPRTASGSAPSAVSGSTPATSRASPAGLRARPSLTEARQAANAVRVRRRRSAEHCHFWSVESDPKRAWSTGHWVSTSNLTFQQWTSVIARKRLTGTPFNPAACGLDGARHLRHPGSRRRLWRRPHRAG